MSAAASLIRQLHQTHRLDRTQWCALLDESTQEEHALLTELARAEAQKHFGARIYLRGLIEFSNYCKNNCFYCGIRSGNRRAERYRLTP